MRQFKLLSLLRVPQTEETFTLKPQPAFILYIYVLKSCDWVLAKWDHQTGVTLHY